MIAANHETSTFAIVSVSAYTLGASPLGALALGLVGAFTSDWPDIDAEKSRVISALWWMPWFPHLMQMFSAWVWECCATDADRRNTAGNWGPRFRVHRGFWHSVWGAALTTAIWWAVLKVPAGYFPTQAGQITDWFALGVPGEVLIATAIGAGMVGHVLGDSCTDFGTAPLAPVWYWRGHRYVKMGLWEPLRFKVGKDVEHALIAPLCLAAVGWALVGIWTGLWTWWALLGAGAGFAWGVLGVIVGKRRRKKLVRTLTGIKL